jgi:hypothetical protein
VEVVAAVPPPAGVAVGLRLLSEARRCAGSLRRGVWDFAVEIKALLAAGLTTTDLRWLVCKRYVEHAVETTEPGRVGRSFQPGGELTFADGTCFVLTEAGGRDGPPVVPRWDGQRRELRVGEVLVKCFRVPAENQVLILEVFEEEGWPDRIDDPLPPQPEMDPQRRLSEAIRRLNRNQHERLLHFYGDGTGKGVCWLWFKGSARGVPGARP